MPPKSSLHTPSPSRHHGNHSSRHVPYQYVLPFSSFDECRGVGVEGDAPGLE